MRCAGRRLHGALLVSRGFLAKYGGAREFARQRGEKAGLLRTGGLDGEILGANEQLMQAAEEVDGAARVEDAEMADGDVADGRDAHEGPRQGGGGLEVGPQGIVLLLRRAARHLAEDGGYVLDYGGFVSWGRLGLGAWPSGGDGAALPGWSILAGRENAWLPGVSRRKLGGKEANCVWRCWRNRGIGGNW